MSHPLIEEARQKLEEIDEDTSDVTTSHSEVAMNKYLVTFSFVVPSAIDPIHAQFQVLESNDYIPISCSAEMIEEGVE